MPKFLVLTNRADSKGNRVMLQGLVLPQARTVVLVVQTVPIVTPIAIVTASVNVDGVYIEFNPPDELLDLFPSCELAVHKTERNLMGMTAKSFQIVYVQLSKFPSLDPNIYILRKQLKNQQADEHASD